MNRRPLAPKASDAPTETPESVAFPTPHTETPHETFTPHPAVTPARPDDSTRHILSLVNAGDGPAATPERPADLMRLLTELAALPPEQRAAIAALLSPAAPKVTLPPSPPVAGPVSDDEPDRLHRGYEGGTR